MNKILTSLLMISVIAGMAGAGTWAYFSDTETSAGDTFTAGTIDLDLETKIPFALEGKPSEVKTANITVKNIGTNDGIKYIHFTNVVDSGGATPNDPELEADPTNETNDISTKIEVDINGFYLDLNGDGKPDTLAQLASKNIKLGELKTQESETDTISFHVRSLAGNEYQGDVSTFDIEFGLRQINDPNLDLKEPVWLSP